MTPDPALLARFAADLDALVAPGERVGIAVSGGPDSLALLLLAAAARPGLVEAATVDHALRPDSQAEAEMVTEVCARLGVPHAILSLEWPEPPATAIQEQARDKRYAALGNWLEGRALQALLTAHHADDQAETLLMRLARGAGVRGLAGMRPVAPLPGRHQLKIIRPLLGWRRSELEGVCAAAGVRPADDPSNLDDRFERVRVRSALGETGWLDPPALARSAANFAAADEALDWAADREWAAIEREGEALLYRPGDAPPEIRRRVIARAIAALAREGRAEAVRGRELDRLLAVLETGRAATLRGVKCTGGGRWRFEFAPPRY